MTLSKPLVLLAALLATAALAGLGYLVLQPPASLITHAGFSTDTISPNADGQNDVAVFSYGLSRNATISLSFEHEDRRVYAFREEADRPQGDFSVNFSGVVDGYTLPGEEIAGTIERRLIPNGTYTWTLRATDHDGETDVRRGTLTITQADTVLPRLSFFEVSADRFTPNQDGIRDRVRVNVFLSKAADLRVFLEDANGVKHFLPERLEGRQPGEPGNHEYDYDGGVDDGYEPPPDGTYTLYAVAQDAVGQRIVRQRTLIIEDGGLPQMEIFPQATGAPVCFYRLPWDEAYYTDLDTIGEKIARPEETCSDLSTLTLEQGDLLVFKLTVHNYGRTPVRTHGPFPGTVYEFEQQSNALGYLEQDGTFRVGIECQTAATSFPWRWAVGDPDSLDVIYDAELDETLYYLPPDSFTEVWGAIRMTKIFEARNPQNCWAGLIHEGVQVDPFQSNVGRREIELVPRPAQQNRQDMPDNAFFGG